MCSEKLLLIFLFFVKLCHQMVIEDSSAKDGSLVEGFLHKYGYLDSVDNMTDSKLSEAIKEFQSFHGMDISGTMNSEMIKMMNKPRCGMPDRSSPKGTAAARFRWRKHHLLYRIKNTHPSISATDFANVMREATNKWTDVANLTISETDSSQVDIWVNFERGDGAGNTLAYAYYPEVGDIYFDSLENWSLNSNRGTNINWVAIHELGHSLGLTHSKERNSIMYPYYNPGSITITNLDENRITDIYGRSTKGVEMPFCKNPSVDAILRVGDGEYLFLQGNLYTKISRRTGYITDSLTKIYKDFPGNVDAAVQSSSNVTFFFKGDEFYKYQLNYGEDYKITKEKISERFLGIPSNVDAVFYDYNSKKIYFFKGELYYVLEKADTPQIRLSIDGGKISSDWKGIPNDVEAASYVGQNKTIFIKSGKIYRVSLDNFKMVEGYPKSVKSTVFQCKS